VDYISIDLDYRSLQKDYKKAVKSHRMACSTINKMWMDLKTLRDPPQDPPGGKRLHPETSGLQNH
jgi:hypothetical protein